MNKKSFLIPHENGSTVETLNKRAASHLKNYGYEVNFEASEIDEQIVIANLDNEKAQNNSSLVSAVLTEHYGLVDRLFYDYAELEQRS